MKDKANLYLPHISTKLKTSIYKAKKTFVNTSMRTKIEKGSILVINKVDWKYLRQDVLNITIWVAQIGKEGQEELSLNVRTDQYSDFDKLKSYFDDIFKNLGFKN